MIYFPANTLFKIESIVDAHCERIEDYSNVHRGGDKSAVQNWDTLRMRLASSTTT